MASEVDCGVKSPVLLASYNPDTQSWKTSQTSLVATGDDGLDEFSETWPRSGMTRNGTAYQLPRLARTITEIGSGLSATKEEFYWRTPDTGSGGTPKAIFEGKTHRKSGSAIQIRLSDQVKLWPTPTANEDAAGTPNGKMQKMLGNHPSLRGNTPEEWALGTLNPTWVEWLMGFPLDHTDLNA